MPVADTSVNGSHPPDDGRGQEQSSACSATEQFSIEDPSRGEDPSSLRPLREGHPVHDKLWSPEPSPPKQRRRRQRGEDSSTSHATPSPPDQSSVESSTANDLDARMRRLEAMVGAHAELMRLHAAQMDAQDVSVRLAQLVEARVDARVEFDEEGDEDQQWDAAEEHHRPESMYAYCVETALHSVRLWTAGIAFVQLLVLSTTQLLMAFGFYDAAVLELNKKSLRPFVDPVPDAEFYRVFLNGTIPGLSDSDNTFTRCIDTSEGETCGAQPKISMLASCIAIAYLTAGPMLVDDIQTLEHGRQPLDSALFHHHRPDYKGSKVRHAWPLHLAWRWLCACVMQVCWMVRALLVPTFGALGTALLMAAASSAVDIVL